MTAPVRPDDVPPDAELVTREDGTTVWTVIPRTQPNIIKDWITVMQPSLAAMAADRAVTLDIFRVRDFLLATMAMGNLYAIPMAEIARRLGLDPSNVRRAVNRLVDYGLLMEGAPLGKTRTFEVNPKFAWRGSHRAIGKAQMSWEERSERARKRREREAVKRRAELRVVEG